MLSHLGDPYLGDQSAVQCRLNYAKLSDAVRFGRTETVKKGTHPVGAVCQLRAAT